MKTSQNIYEELADFDCTASIAYALMQRNRGLLSDEEFSLLKQAFQEISLMAKGGSFLDGQKDVCQVIDTYLVQRLKKLGEKFCTMRPLAQRLRLDLYLLMRGFSLKAIHQLIEIAKMLYLLKTPETLKMWDQTISEACLHDMTRLKEIYLLINRFPSDDKERDEFRMLGFGRLMNQPVLHNYSSGKIQAFLLHHLVQIINSLSMLTSVLPLIALPELRTLPKPIVTQAMDSIRIQADIVTDCLIQVLEISESKNLSYEKTIEPTLYGIEITNKGLHSSLELLKQLPHYRKNSMIPDTIKRVLKTNLDWHRYHKRNWDIHSKNIL